MSKSQYVYISCPSIIQSFQVNIPKDVYFTGERISVRLRVVNGTRRHNITSLKMGLIQQVTYMGKSAIHDSEDHWFKDREIIKAFTEEYECGVSNVSLCLFAHS